MTSNIKNARFLRPASTSLIIQRLQRGDSLNLSGGRGIGKTRLLEDIKSANLENTCVIHVSLKGYQESYKAFCNAVFLSSDFKVRPPSSLNAVIKKLKETKKQTFLFIDDFQYISDNPNLDPKYNQQFIDYLNSIRNTSGISLLAVSHEPLSKIIIFMGKKPVTSVLNLQNIHLDRLMHHEITDEISRRFQNLDENAKNVLASHLNNHENNYELLEHYESKIISKGDTVLDSAVLDRWYKNFKKTNRSSLMRLVIKLTGVMKRWILVITPFLPGFNQLKKITHGPLVFISSYVKKILGASKDTE